MEKYYRKVPQPQLDEFLQFRRTHPPKTALLNGVSWEYLTAGSASSQPLLLLPGALSTAESAWRTLLLLEQLGRYRLLCPGYPPELDTMTALADGIRELLSLDGVTSTFVVGGSYGGMLAQVFAHRHPSLVTRLVLSHTYPPTSSRAGSVQPALRLFRSLPMFLVKKMLRDRMTGILPPRPTPELLLVAAQVHETVDTKLTRQAALSTFLRMVDFDQQSFSPSDFASWPGKTLILLAQDDPTTPETLRNALVDLYPGADLHLFQGSGHATAILESAEYIRVIDDFLAQ